MQDLFAPFDGAIVRAWMPETEHACVPGPKFRPVLLLAEDRRVDGTLEVLVAYGTSQQAQRCGRGEVLVRKTAAPFLDNDTKFCLRKRMWLPVTEEFFKGDERVVLMGKFPRIVFAKLADACREAGISL